MLAANKPKLERTPDMCLMRPLRQCLEDNFGDMRQCTKEVNDFERTCNKRKGYVHDREGLDEIQSGLWSGKKEI